MLEFKSVARQVGQTKNAIETIVDACRYAPRGATLAVGSDLIDQVRTALKEMRRGDIIVKTYEEHAGSPEGGAPEWGIE